METTTTSAAETKGLGEKIAASLNKDGVIGLVGDLGSGKTTFIQGFARGLGIKQRIISPTFILMRHYNISHGAKQKRRTTDFYHVDLYRLERNIESELENLGFKEIIKNERHVTVVEWADKAVRMYPSGTQWIEFETISKNKRKIKFSKL